MKRLIFLLLLLSLAVILSGCGTKNLESAVNKGAVQLDGAALKKLFTGSTVHASGYGQEAEIIFHENNKLSATNTNKEKDSGKWSVRDDDLLCMQFYQWGEKQTLCYLVYDQDNNLLLFNKQGLQLYSFTITEKGPVNLEEEIHYSSPSEEKIKSPATSASPESKQPPPIPFTRKTAEDVQFILRQTAQNCPGCNLAKAQLSGHILIGANLEGANLTEADLSDAVLRRANLQGANLYKANLRDADLMGANLTGANLTEADLTGAKTQGAIGYTH
jgi:hypothetical protein